MLLVIVPHTHIESTIYFSQKYGTLIDLKNPRIVGIFGNAPASVSDIELFRGGKKGDKDNWYKDSLYFKIPEGKMVIADSGLAGEPDKILTDSSMFPADMRRYISEAKARQETLHSRLKSFNILKYRFHHGTSTEHKFKLHEMVVDAIAVGIQYDYENGHGPFDMQY